MPKGRPALRVARRTGVCDVAIFDPCQWVSIGQLRVAGLGTVGE